MRAVARVLFDESHRQAWSTRPEVAARMQPANPADCGLMKAARTLRTAGFDVAVHASGPLDPDVLARADAIENATVQDPVHRFRDVSTWIAAHGACPFCPSFCPFWPSHSLPCPRCLIARRTSE